LYAKDESGSGARSACPNGDMLVSKGLSHEDHGWSDARLIRIGSQAGPWLQAYLSGATKIVSRPESTVTCSKVKRLGRRLHLRLVPLTVVEDRSAMLKSALLGGRDAAILGGKMAVTEALETGSASAARHGACLLPWSTVVRVFPCPQKLLLQVHLFLAMVECHWCHAPSWEATVDV
jgi:hypothetical protein